MGDIQTACSSEQGMTIVNTIADTKEVFTFNVTRIKTSIHHQDV